MEAILCPELDGETSDVPPVLLGTAFLLMDLPLCTGTCDGISGGPTVLLEADLPESLVFLECDPLWTGSIHCFLCQFEL